ncbi:DUF3369 domain-containing protein [Idiomarina xiamenensis]|uniref:Response regulator n=1 Tax=Idiomarina xiamenensis 10-D-4 TaxID=740709 RepID=K2K183_9GAMM|nr:DUF3369 domain-containing protein [Idiomarina xiamenensis]EKE80502.1 response regulator [Idiomarina xiamenensis 10-D-4]
MNDTFLFADDTPPTTPAESLPGKDAYQVLIVDDDEEIHTITQMALSEFTLDGHPLQFLSAYSGAQAKQLLQQHPNIAMMLLDVVMETDHAGLDVAHWVRHELKNRIVRIVLRTGQPGQAPEEEVISGYDIDDYKEKTELTYRKLVTLMYSTLRAYRDLRAIERNKLGLEKVISASAEVFSARSMQGLCQGILEQLVALITRADDALYCREQQSTLTASGEQGHPYEIIGATGEYADKVGQPVSGDVNRQVIANLQARQQTVSFCVHEHCYYGLYQTHQQRRYLLFIRGIRELSELDQHLLQLFVNNSSIAIDNVMLMEAMRQPSADASSSS